MSRLNILEHTASIIRDIHNPELDYGTVDWKIFFLWDAFEYAAHKTEREEVRQAISLVFTTLLAEADENEQARCWLFDILEVVIINNPDVYVDINFDVLVEWLPRFPTYVDGVICLLGYSHDPRYVPLIERYIDVDEVEAFDALCNLCWDVSGHSLEVGQMLRREEVREIEFLLINPKRRTVSEAVLQEQYRVIREEVFAKMRVEFKEYNEEQH